MAQDQAQSPYLAESGAVGELGQPRASEPSATHYGGEHVSSEGVKQQPGETNYTDRGLHDDNRHPLQTTQDTNIGHGHEPFTSSAVDSGYAAPGAGPEVRHNKGVGEKMRNAAKGVKDVVTGHKDRQHQQQAAEVGQAGPVGQDQVKSPGFTGKLKDAVTGQKPGQGAATGYATSDSAVPGEEDYVGKTGPGTGGFNQKNDTAGGAEHHHGSGWPHPVPPPGMSNPSPLAGGRSSNQNFGTGEHDATGERLYGSSDDYHPSHDSKPAEGGYPSQRNDYSGSKPVGDSTYSGAPSGGHLPSQRNEYSETNTALGAGDHLHPSQGNDYSGSKPVGDSTYSGAPGGGHFPSQRNEYSETNDSTALGAGDHLHPSQGNDYSGSKPVGDSTYSGAPVGGHLPSQPNEYSNTNRVGDSTAPDVPTDGHQQPFHHNDYSENKPVGGTAHGFDSSASKPSEAGNLHSSPAEPNTRHDTPTAENTGGSHYTDPSGAVQQEGPRDDNVKKEGLMAKMMDKLHLSSNKHKDSTKSPTKI